MSISEYADQSNALHDREERRALQIDALPPIECSGIMWHSCDGDPTTEGAVWSDNWEELLDDANAEGWSFMRSVYRRLSEGSKPVRGDVVPPDLALLIILRFDDDITRMLQERAA